VSAPNGRLSVEPRPLALVARTELADDARPIGVAEVATPIQLDPEAEPDSRLPADHPAWARDVVSISQRARDLFARLRPVAIKIFSAWEHRVRSMFVAGRRVSIDASGCYRAD
jgi:hypothetical protein